MSQVNESARSAMSPEDLLRSAGERVGLDSAIVAKLIRAAKSRKGRPNKFQRILETAGDEGAAD